MEVIIVDAYSSGAYLAKKLYQAGARLTHIKTTHDIPPPVLATYPNNVFYREFSISDWEQSVKNADLPGAENVVCIIPGTETGVLLADHLVKDFRLKGNGFSKSASRRDKFQMTETLKQNGLATTSHYVTTDIDSLLQWISKNMSYPVVIKPIDSAGSDGVRLCREQTDVISATSYILYNTSKLGLENNHILVQDFLEGNEFIVDTVSRDGLHLITDICRSVKRFRPNGVINYDFIELVPFQGEAQTQLVNYFRQVLSALEIHFGAAHGELMLTHNGPVLIEVAARLAGANLPQIFGSHVTHNATDAMVDACLFPRQFHKRLHQPSQLKTRCRIVFFELDMSGRLIKPMQHTEFSQLSSFSFLHWPHETNAVLPKTVDLFTSPGYVVLTHYNQQVIEDDTHAVRCQEKTHYEKWIEMDD